MLSPTNHFYCDQKEPESSVFQFIRSYILSKNSGITESVKYGMPFFSINKKMVCYLWYHKKYKQPYLGIVEGAKVDHPDLLQEKRSRMKILLINPDEDIPTGKIDLILTSVLNIYL